MYLTSELAQRMAAGGMALPIQIIAAQAECFHASVERSFVHAEKFGGLRNVAPSLPVGVLQAFAGEFLWRFGHGGFRRKYFHVPGHHINDLFGVTPGG
jgi:hypothetical protein